MGRFTEWMEKNFVPFATKISSEKHLVAIRDSFIALMPVTMAGSVAVLLNVFFRDLPGQFNIPAIPKTFSWLIDINGNVWWACVGFFAVAFAFSFGYHLAKAYDVNPIAGGLVSFASLLTVSPQVHNDAWGGLNWTYTNANGLFTALILGFVVTMIFIKLTKKNIIIKMPEGVPSAVSNAFASIIPGLAAIFVAGSIGYISTQFFGKPLNDIVVEFVQAPFMSLAQGLPTVILVVIAVQLFWFFGLHGTNILGPLLEGVYKTALLENSAAYEAGLKIPNAWTGASFNAYAWMGGAGCTIALIIALLLFSKKQGEREVAKLSLPMGVFNINEPITFGVPIVLNSVYFIPYIFIPLILTLIGYFATIIGFAGPTVLEVPWIVPPVLYAFLTTAGNFGAAIVALFNLIIAVVLWSVFVKIANKVKVD